MSEINTPFDIIHDDEKFRLWVCVSLSQIQNKLEGIDNTRQELAKLKEKVFYISGGMAVIISVIMRFLWTWLK